MPWPTGSDYQTVVQNPKTAFRDSELQDCTVRLGAMGMPWVASGNFAFVFCLEHPNGQKYAARVFNRQVTVQKARYQAVSDHLGGIAFQFMVGFQYQEDGIQIAGQWYPIIKMDWADGVQFGRFVEDNSSDPDALRYVAAQFRAVYSGLQGANMSHCDLQHGNIMVSPAGNLVLVDYDDFFVPKLAGETALALGMPNYQHPKRGASDFNEKIDNFSSLVIYMSLGVLAADSLLYAKYNNGDNIVLKESDYKDLNSPVWLDLSKSSDPVVRDMVDAVRDACGKPVDKCPSLEEVIKQTGALPAGKRPAIQTQVAIPTTPVTPITRPIQPTPTAPAARPIAVLPQSQHNFGPVVEGTTSLNWNLEIKNDRTATTDLIVKSAIASDPRVVVSYTPKSIKPGDNFFIAVRFDLTGVSTAQPVRITETITVDTNDKQSVVTVICDVMPTPKPNIVVPGMYSFPYVLIGSQGNCELDIRNTGAGDLQNLSVSCPDPSVRISPYPQTIAAGTTEKVTVVYEPSLAGDLDTMVTVSGTNTQPQDIRLVGHVAATGIRRIVPGSSMVGDKDVVVTVEGVGFVQDRRPYDVWSGQGKNQTKKTEYDIFNPAVSFSVPVFVADSIQFLSTTAFRVSVTVPKTCPPGNYDVIVTNPDGSQIIGKDMLVIQGLSVVDPATGKTVEQIRCPHCNEPVDKSKKWCDKCGLPLRSSVLSRV